MLIRATGQLLGVFLLVVMILALLFYMFHQSDRVDSRFEIRMLKDINKIRSDLEGTDLEEKTVRTITYALENIYWNVNSYVNEKLFVQFFSILFLVAIFVLLLSVRGINQKKAIT